jgi:vacuolar-type H+-ATPase subunit B/Vma2
MLEHHADFRTGMIEIGFRVRDQQIIDTDGSAINRFQCIERTQLSTFSGSRRTYNYQNLTFLYRERHVTERTMRLAVACCRIGLADMVNRYKSHYSPSQAVSGKVDTAFAGKSIHRIDF